MACYVEIPQVGGPQNTFMSIEAFNFLLNYYYASLGTCEAVENQILNVVFPNHDRLFITSNIIDLTTIQAIPPVGFTGTTSRFLSEVGQTFPSSLQHQFKVDIDFVGGVEVSRSYDLTDWPYGTVWNPALSGWDFRAAGTPIGDMTFDLVGAKLTDIDFACVLGEAIPACAVVPPTPTVDYEIFSIANKDIRLANFARIMNPFGIRKGK